MEVAIITGGSRGLGAALCAEYQNRGWAVIEFSRAAPHPFSVELDLADARRTAALLDGALSSVAEADIDEVVVVSNAAVLGPVGPLERAEPAAIERHLAVNVTAPALLVRAFATRFQEHDCPKTFVNISSGAASKGYAGWSLYCASKAATDNLVRAVALEQQMRAQPIRAFNVNPGVMDTDMQTLVRSADIEDFPELERYLRLKSEGRLAAPGRVAGAIADLVASRPEPGRVYAVGQ